uniref:placenta-expressed transcript 1 protein n=1 Tax=Jaculus jaculus TaxID=51337 RepID=UPI00064CFFE4|nr:placenta-expressed transcript 1 protein [Jaculus jaculus]
MPVSGSSLPQLGLFLCLTLCFSSAFYTSYDNCMVFDHVFTTNNSGIKIEPEVFENNTIYTVLVPVNKQVRTVILQAVDKDNSSVGLWDGADEECNNSTALYHGTHVKDSFIRAHWIAPKSKDITELELHVFVVNVNGTAAFSSLELGHKVLPTAFTSTTKIPEDSQTTAKTTTLTTTKTTTLTTASSFAIRVLSSPITGAFHILLVFLTSKFLF